MRTWAFWIVQVALLVVMVAFALGDDGNVVGAVAAWVAVLALSLVVWKLGQLIARLLRRGLE